MILIDAEQPADSVGRPSAMSALPRIPKMAEIVAAELRGKILSGELQAGESLLSEATLIERYGVSRPTLREALRLLEAQSLITVRRGSHRGPVVEHPDISVVSRAVATQLQLRRVGVVDVYAFRMIYEPIAARLAAEKATPQDIARLREIIEEERAHTGHYAAFAETVWSFHSSLIALSGNATMSVVTESLQHISASHAAKAMSVSPDRDDQQRKSVRAHTKLVDLLERRAGAEAEKFWARHMEAVAETQRSWLGDQPITEVLV